MTEDGNLVRDDSTDFERHYQFIPFTCLYGMLCLYSVWKLVKNWRMMKRLIRFVFLNLCAFFFIRTLYWLDFVLQYPTILYFFLELLPYFWLISICSILAFSWLQVALCFMNDIKHRHIAYIGMAVIGLNALMYAFFLLMYFYTWFIHREDVMLAARIQNNIWLFVCICFLVFTGQKLAAIVSVYLAVSYGRRIRFMMWTSVCCLALRILINTLLLVLSSELARWKKADGGQGHAAFSIMDYLITEVGLLFFLTYAIQVPMRKSQFSDHSEVSCISQETDLSRIVSSRLVPLTN